jgi:propionyl-CoA carboxylase beta chain
MGAQGAVNILHRRTLAEAEANGGGDAESTEAVRARLIQEYEDTLLNPYIAAENGYVDAVVAPSQTRSQIVRGLRHLRTKRESLPPKKHGNIPL